MLKNAVETQEGSVTRKAHIILIPHTYNQRHSSSLAFLTQHPTSTARHFINHISVLIYKNDVYGQSKEGQ
jgi:hypothetical protein